MREVRKTQPGACAPGFKPSEMLVSEVAWKRWPEGTGSPNLGLVQASYSPQNVSELFSREPTFGGFANGQGPESKTSSS